MVRRRVLACALMLSLAGSARMLGDGAAGGAAGEEGEGLGAKILGWATDKLTGTVGGKVEELVFSSLLSGTPFASGDPNGPVLDELRAVERKLDQISSQLNTLSQDVAAGLQEVGCDTQASAYTTKVLISADDRSTLEGQAEWLQELADPTTNATSRAEVQKDIRDAFAGDSRLVQIHRRIHDYGAITVHAFHDAMRACGRFLNRGRLQRIQDQYAWMAGLQVASCQLVINHYFDRAKSQGTADPTTDIDYRSTVRDCQGFVDELKPLATTGTLPDDQTVYEIPTALLWKWTGQAGGRWSCYGGFKCRGSINSGCYYDGPCDDRSELPWAGGNKVHLRIPEQISYGDCHDFCVSDPGERPLGATAYTLERQVFGDATQKLQEAGVDWLMPRESDVQAFIGTECRGRGDEAVKPCLAGEGWAAPNGNSIFGDGGFYLWALPDRWNSSRSRSADSLWVVNDSAGPAGPTGDPGNSAGVLLVRDKTAGERFILDRSTP